MKPEAPKGNTPAVPESVEIRVAHQSLHIGPLPSPTDLAQYGEIVEGGAERIMRMAEAFATHMQSQERAELERRFRLADAGQRFGLVMGLAALAVCLVVALTGHDAVAVALAASAVVGGVVAFVRSQAATTGDREPG
jgi:uncharacterized membrane protein